MNKRLIISAIVFSILSVFSFMKHSQIYIESKLDLVFAVICFVTIFFCAGYYILKYALNRLQSMSNANKLKLVLIATLLTAIGFTVLLDYMPQKAVEKQVEIVLVESKELEKREGNELWFSSLVIDDNKVDPETLVYEGDWKTIDGLPMTNMIGSTVVWKGRVINNISLHFVSHPWSGTVKLLIDGQKYKEFDLYSDIGKTLTENIQIEPTSNKNVFLYLSNLILIYIYICCILLISIRFLNNRTWFQVFKRMLTKN